MSHVHGYPTNPKVYQALEFADLYQGPNHELISKYQVHPFGRAGTIHSLVWGFVFYASLLLSIILLPTFHY